MILCINFKMPKIESVIVLPILSIILEFCCGQQYSETQCNRIRDDRNSSYVCKKVKECAVAKQLFSAGKAVSCRSENGVHYVCCPVVPSTPTEIATQKCKEYSKVVNTTVRNYSQLIKKLDSSPTKLDCYRNEELRTGGRPALPKEYPHMALLGYHPTDSKTENFNLVQWSCGGSLISEHFVLTVAHCVQSIPTLYVKWVLLGDLDIESTKDDATPQVYDIIDKFIHPNYTHPHPYNDIALLKLNATVVFTPYIRPICLYTLQSIPAFEKKASVTGWGAPKTGALRNTFLSGSTIFFYADTLCKAEYNDSLFTRGFDSKTMICAGDIDSGSDTCAGDGGGPLQILIRDMPCMWNQVGITSFGSFFCEDKKPSVYTKVSFYIDWIQSLVWP